MFFNLPKVQNISFKDHLKIFKPSVLLIIISLTLLIGVFDSETLNAGSFTDSIKEKCPTEYRHHKDTVKKFAIRMKPFVEECGCGVVNLYDSLGDSNLALISSLEEDMDMMRSATKIFEISSDLNDALKESPEIVETLTLFANMDPALFQKLSKALSSFSKHDARQLRKDSSYILFYLLASSMIDPKERDLKLILKNLKRNVSLNAISSLSMLYLQSRTVYPNADPHFWMSAAEMTLQALGKKTVKALVPYKEYLALFLPPKEDDIPESQNLSSREIQKIRQDYMDLMVFVFNLIDSIDGKDTSALALKVTQHIYPYLLDALRFHGNKKEIKRYLNYELKSNNFGYILKNGVCQAGGEDAGLENYFIMYSPYEDGQPVPGTKGNLGLIAKCFVEGTLRKYQRNSKDINGYIYTMSLLPHIYLSLTNKQKSVFTDLLFNLSEHQILNGQVIITLYDKTRFFSWAQNSPDAFLNVTHNEDVSYGQNALKYKYILLTSYPKDKSPSILHSFGEKSIPSNDLNRLMNLPIDRLEAHNFTSGERYVKLTEDALDIADWTITAVSIVAVPFTAGASAGVAAMMLARKGAISAAKRSMKTLGKRSLKSTMKLMGKQGLKVAKREAKEVIGFAAKRGRKSMKEEAIKKGVRNVEKWNDRVGIAHFAGAVSAGAMAYYFANNSQFSVPTDLCSEIKEMKKGD